MIPGEKEPTASGSRPGGKEARQSSPAVATEDTRCEGRALMMPSLATPT